MNARGIVGAALLAAAAVAGCGDAQAAAGSLVVQGDAPAVAGSADRAAFSPATARARLEHLPVKGRAAKTGYSRDEFGPAWADVDHNSCDTRNDILARDLTGERLGPDGCTVLTGTLHDPYGGKVIAFRRGVGTSSKVQIDHVVALSDAWQTGAQQLTAAKREQLANDPLNLLAVDGPLNQQKSDSDAASWLPPRKAYRCSYVERQVAVKTRYRLWVTPAEHDAIARVLKDC